MVSVDNCRYRTAQNFGGIRIARKLVEKFLVPDHINNSSLLELTKFGGFGRSLIACQIRQSFVLYSNHTYFECN